MLALKNSTSQFGLVSIVLHWIIALLTLGLFGLGVWMVDLDYYSEWYQLAPWLHKGIGVTLVALSVARWFWQLINLRPLPVASVPKWQQVSAHIVHVLMTILIVLIGLTGYFLVTAKGHVLSVFDLVYIPATLTGIANLEDVMGDLHKLSAYLLMSLVVLHVVAALKHHFVNKDETLLRILGRRPEH